MNNTLYKFILRRKANWLALLTPSQGGAATRLRCGGQCNKHFVANLEKN